MLFQVSKMKQKILESKNTIIRQIFVFFPAMENSNINEKINHSRLYGYLKFNLRNPSYSTDGIFPPLILVRLGIVSVQFQTRGNILGQLGFVICPIQMLKKVIRLSISNYIASQSTYLENNFRIRERP